MKILKPGKVEQRKFVCPNCGCEFLAGEYEKAMYFEKDKRKVFCPTCRKSHLWDNGEPYEEPAQTAQGDMSRLTELLKANAYVYLGRSEIVADYLITNGVTFREDAP